MKSKAIENYFNAKFPSMSLLPELDDWTDLAEIDGYYAGSLKSLETREFTVKHLEWLEEYLEKNKEFFVKDGIYEENKHYLSLMRKSVEEYVKVNNLKWK